MMDEKYRAILDLPHHTSATHPRMSLHARAAQFSPFSALTGFEDIIEETSRLTDSETELSEDEQKALDQRLRELSAVIPEHPGITVTYFKKDSRKRGGSYVTVTGALKEIDEYARSIVLADGTSIPIGLIKSIS